MLTSIDQIDVKFIFDSARLGLFTSANILQIADVALRVVFLLFLPCFQLLFSLVLTLETSEMSAIFVFKTKTTRSALVNIRQKALLSSVEFRKRMTSARPVVYHVWFCFDRILSFD